MLATAPTAAAAGSEVGWAAVSATAGLRLNSGGSVAWSPEPQHLSRRAVLAWARREADAPDGNPTVGQLETMVELLVGRLAPAALERS